MLQRVNELFPPAINLDIAAVTRHLASRGVRSPAPIRATGGALWIEHDGNWRALDWVDGVSLQTARSASDVREAGRILGEFHASLEDFGHEFQCVRSDPHEPARHAAALTESVERKRHHAACDRVAPVAQAILDAGSAMPALIKGPARVVHGEQPGPVVHVVGEG